MAGQETRRTNPIAHVTLVFVIILLVFQGLIIGRVFELKAQTVAKHAPWAYEPFLRLVSEHPDSAPRWVEVEEVEDTAESTLPSGIVLPAETNETTIVTNVVPEVESSPAGTSTNTPPVVPEEFVPVG